MRRRDDIDFIPSEEEIEIYKKCANDIIEFTKYVPIFHPKKGWPMAYSLLFPKQKKILRRLSKNWEKEFSLILSARQSGKTTIILLLIIWIITFEEAKVIGILANKQSSSKVIFNRFSTMYHKLPKMFRLAKEISDSKTDLILNDGTRVFCGPTSKSGLRSESISLLILDEFAYVDHGIDKEFWIANYPTIEQSGSLIVTSTPNGKNNVFYSLYEKAKDKNEKKWRLYEVWWHEVFNRGLPWKKQKIKDLETDGKNGEEAFEREYNNSFDVGAVGIRFFNQESVSQLEARPHHYEYTPSANYEGYGIKVFDDIREQHFLVGVDIAEGKGLNFSALSGIGVRKRNLGQINDNMSYEMNQTFHYMSSDILPDDFFNLTFKFCIDHLNDQWFLIFDNMDVGRIWVMRLEGLFEELQTGINTRKNEIFKDILINKFESDRHAMIAYLSRRIYLSTGTKNQNTWGLRTDRKNNVVGKSNMKSLIDKRMIDIYDNTLIEEMRLWEDKRIGGETMVHEGYEGVSHFDGITALKYALWPLQDRGIMSDIMSISPLKSGNKTREQQVLEAILGGNKKRSKTDFLKDLHEQPDIGLIWDKRDGVIIDGVIDITPNWNRRYSSLYFKK